MASTNKTSNYELSQFLGTDKPAWLSDYNQDMSKIDTQMKANADAATAAGGSATSANTAIGTLANLTTTAKTDLVSAINEVDSNADTAQNTANSASSNASSAILAINNLNAYLNLNNFTTPTITITGGNNFLSSNFINCASNADGSLGKIYGRIGFDTTGSSASVSFPTPLRPTSDLTINGTVLSQWSDDGNSWSSVSTSTLTIATDGTATVSITGSAAGRGRRLTFVACVIFAKPFADVPTPD